MFVSVCSLNQRTCHRINKHQDCALDTAQCTHVPDPLRKGNQQIPDKRMCGSSLLLEGVIVWREAVCGQTLWEVVVRRRGTGRQGENPPALWVSTDGTLSGSECGYGWQRLWRCEWPPSTCMKRKRQRVSHPVDTYSILSTVHITKYTELYCTCQSCTRSQIWSSRRGIWNAVWRHSPCGCFQTQWGWWQSSPTGGDWPVDSHPGERIKQSKAFWISWSCSLSLRIHFTSLLCFDDVQYIKIWQYAQWLQVVEHVLWQSNWLLRN